MSHACGMGDEVPQDVVKLMLLLKIQGLSYGHSGVQLITIQRLIDFYNNDVLPCCLRARFFRCFWRFSSISSPCLLPLIRVRKSKLSRSNELSGAELLIKK